MATRIYGISKGENRGTYVTEGVGSAVAADDFEFTVDFDTNSPTRQDTINALKMILDHIQTGDWPPA